jgi:hypothetical protein
MNPPYPAHPSREIAASDGFGSLSGIAPRAITHAFVPCVDWEPWRPTPDKPRRAVLVARALRRVQTRRRSSVVEHP